MPNVDECMDATCFERLNSACGRWSKAQMNAHTCWVAEGGALLSSRWGGDGEVPQGGGARLRLGELGALIDERL